MFGSIASIWLLGVAFAPTLAAASADAEHTVTVRMTGMRSSAGKVRVVLHDRAEGFPGQNPRQRAQASIEDGAAVVRFAGLPDGTYAVSMFHDENGNGTLDETWFGRPTEGVGSSNNPRPKMRAPTFQEASFSLTGNRTVSILVRYF
jgi:uncharacterized protein (DUF2141 family)